MTKVMTVRELQDGALRGGVHVAQMDVLRAVGLADSCELMSAAFSFPDQPLAQALVDDSFAQDVVACLTDAGAEEAAVQKVKSTLSVFWGADAAELFGVLKKGYSILYLNPGNDVPVWPYESAFRYTAEKHEGVPSLFRSPRVLDVERHMREAGVLPKNARREPSDSIWNEFSFLSFLYGSLASALQEDRVEGSELWFERIDSFWLEHAGLWFPSFMGRTQEEASACTFGKEYAALSSVGEVVLDVMTADASYRESRG